MAYFFGGLDSTLLAHARRALCLAQLEFQICPNVSQHDARAPVYELDRRRENRERACRQDRNGKAPSTFRQVGRAGPLGQSRNENLLPPIIYLACPPLISKSGPKIAHSLVSVA